MVAGVMVLPPPLTYRHFIRPLEARGSVWEAEAMELEAGRAGGPCGVAHEVIQAIQRPIACLLPCPSQPLWFSA